MNRIIVALAVVLATGCTPRAHRIPPPYTYQGKDYQAAEIEQIAADRCQAVVGIFAPSNPFTTDGCSMWPDGGYRECCIEHDMAYWCAGPTPLRKAADQSLRVCVAARSSGFNAYLVYLGTRLGGGRLMPAAWRWGYGYEYPYAPPTTSLETTGQ